MLSKTMLLPSSRQVSSLAKYCETMPRGTLALPRQNPVNDVGVEFEGKLTVMSSSGSTFRIPQKSLRSVNSVPLFTQSFLHKFIKLTIYRENQYLLQQ